MSWQLRLMGTVMRPIMRKLTERVSDPEVIRRQMLLSARLFFRTPPEAQYEETSYNGQRALWVSSGASSGGEVSHDKVLLYIHGGGYLAGDPDTHKKVVARLCRMAALKAFVPTYSLAPEHPIPASLGDVNAAWKHLRAQGYAAEQIVLGGDSAGGGLAFALLAQLCQRGEVPAGLFAWSPFTDITFSGASMGENFSTDHFFSSARAPELAALILGGTAPDDPRASPLFAEFPDCPPVLLQASHCEILRDDTLRMEEKLRANGTAVRLEMWQDAPHVWHLFDGWMPEARDAIRNTARWINSL